MNDDADEDNNFKLKLLLTKGELYSILEKESSKEAKLVLLQVISNNLDEPSYGGNLICKDLYKIYGASLLYYSIKNQLCKDFFGTNNFNLTNTLKPIYVIANRSNQILHICTNNSKKEILEKLKAAFKETLISESSVVGNRKRRQSEVSFSTNTSEFLGNYRRNGAGSTVMNKPFSKDNNNVNKSPESEYKLVESRFKILATKTTSDFAAY